MSNYLSFDDVRVDWREDSDIVTISFSGTGITVHKDDLAKLHGLLIIFEKVKNLT